MSKQTLPTIRSNARVRIRVYSLWPSRIEWLSDGQWVPLNPSRILDHQLAKFVGDHPDLNPGFEAMMFRRVVGHTAEYEFELTVEVL